MLNSIIEKNLPTIVIFYFKLQSYSTHSPEFTGLKFEIKFLFICGYIFFWIRIQEKFRIRHHPGPQQCRNIKPFFLLKKENAYVGQRYIPIEINSFLLSRYLMLGVVRRRPICCLIIASHPIMSLHHC